MPNERPEAFVFRGPRTLVGPVLKPGDKAPDFTLVDNKDNTYTYKNFEGKPLLISSVPSLDTGVCSRQTARFDQEAAKLGDKVTVLTVSADLPFTQDRWCGANNASNGKVLSDHLDLNFGDAYGTHVKELRIDSRAVFVVDADGTIRYVEYVPVGGQEPNYDQALAALAQAAG